MRKTLVTLIVSLVLVLVCYKRVSAYIDPGTGNMLVQMVIAVCVGTMFYFRNLIKKIIVWIKNIIRKD